jgi:EAL domain-containing protein (putative c-di-GMP-specific phosphodiesterase class I)
MHNAAKETLRLETDLRRAVERGEITVYYQPIFDVKSGRIESLESLARWEHPSSVLSHRISSSRWPRRSGLSRSFVIR